MRHVAGICLSRHVSHHLEMSPAFGNEREIIIIIIKRFLRKHILWKPLSVMEITETQDR